MVEPFKTYLHADSVAAAGRHLNRVWPEFDRRRFELMAGQGLDALELKQRAMQIAAALRATLPQDFEHAAAVIEASLAPPLPDHEGVSQQRDDAAGLSGWVIWSFGEYVARAGQAQPARALEVLHALTQRFTAEWAIRPFIVSHPQLSFATLQRWVHDPSVHVRRLVSEGSRPRLPWGLQLKGLIADPSPTLPLLEALQDDASPYVRRSVANHLNDIAKDHPGLIALWLDRHLPGASVERTALLRHACRTLIKQGDAPVLRAWGLGRRLKGEVSLRVAPRRVRLGGDLAIDVQLASTARRPQSLLIDYAVHHVKANGSTSPKVFKGWAIELAPGETRALSKRHALKPITTRRYFAGEHAVELFVNGASVAREAFHLATGGRADAQPTAART